MERSDFDELLHRYLTGQVSESERVRIEAWLDVMKSGRAHDLQLSQADEERLFEGITRRIDNMKEAVSLRAENYRSARFFHSFAFMKVVLRLPVQVLGSLPEGSYLLMFSKTLLRPWSFFGKRIYVEFLTFVKSLVR